MNDTLQPPEPQEKTKRKRRKRGKRGGHRKHPHAKASPGVNSLAKSILHGEDIADTEEEQPEVIETAEIGEEEFNAKPSVFQEVRTPVVVEKPPEPIKLEHGYNVYSSYIIQRTESEIFNVLMSIFGAEDGDYFTLGDNTVTRFVIEINKPQRFKTVLVEDKNGFRYTIWFNVTRLSLI